MIKRSLNSNKIKSLIKKNLFNLNTIIFGFPLYFWFLIILFSLFKLFLLSGQHMFAIGYAVHDDRLFINIANNLLRLDWLGDYNNLTLAKGPGYPIWIATSFILGIPLLFSQNLLSILASIIFIIAIKPLFLRNHFFLIILYILILFNPYSFANDVSIRVLREGIYPSLSLLIIAFSAGVFTHRDRIIKSLIIWIIGLSLSLSLFWLTREEGIWILPFLISIFVFTTYKLWKKRSKQWKSKLILFTTPFIILYISILTVSTINYYKYGVFAVVEFKNTEFLEAYGSLTRVKDERWQQFLPVSKDKRKQIYSVSPLFKQIEPFLEDNSGQGWSKISSDALRLNNSGEIFGGWFMWAFRNAVEAAGYYKNGKDTLEYYRQLSTEIDTACRNKLLNCFERRKTMMDPFYNEQVILIFDSIINTTGYLISFKRIDVNRTSIGSPGNKDSLELFSKISHEPIYELKESGYEISGWAFSPSDKIILGITNNNGKSENFSIEISDSYDVYEFFSKQEEYFDNAKRARFKISTSCIDGCSLLIIGENGVNEKIPLDNSITSINNDGELFFHLDDLGVKQKNTELKNVMDKIDNIKLIILNRISSLYSILMIPLIILSVLIFLMATFIKNKKNNDLYFFNLFLLLSIFVRILMIAIINATSFYAINDRYLSPLYPMIIIFTLFNLFSLKSLFKKNENKKNKKR